MLQPYMETIGVLLLAVAGVWAGLRAARARRPLWIAAYLVPLLLITAIAVSRCFDGLEFVAPFRWIMADRREFALLAFLCTSVLVIPLSKLPHRRQRGLVWAFMVLAVTVYSVLPFLLPALNYSYLRNMKTFVDVDGVCLQNNNYDCGPAAAVTALRHLGISAEEGELAILAHTTSAAGTPADSLCAAIRQRYYADDVRCEYRCFRSVGELRGLEPVIATVKYGFLVDHYVTVLNVTGTTVTVGDPLEGLKTLTHAEFDAKWRHSGIIVGVCGHLRTAPVPRRNPPENATTAAAS